MENTTHLITFDTIGQFTEWLKTEERSEGTISKYRRDIFALMIYLDGQALTKETAMQWKERLTTGNHAPTTVNSMLAALNTYCSFARLGFKVKFLKIQRRLYRDDSRELTQKEYEKLISTAVANGNDRLALLMETIAATGIRVSEVQYITVEAAKARTAQISLKGKIRDILLPVKLCKKLIKYAAKNKIVSGKIFITRNGNGISRKQIWTEMKAVCKKAGVSTSKVFPHNLRHLFARVYYKVTRDVAKLADLLGHSSIETTRIYLLSTGEEHARQLERLGLVL